MAVGKPALRLNWTTPESDQPIIRYQVTYRRVEDYIWMAIFTSSVSLILGNLSAGTRYEIRIRATSDIGFGSYGESITMETYSGKIIMHFNYPQCIQCVMIRLASLYWTINKLTIGHMHSTNA